MTRMQAAWIGWYLSGAQAFDAMADRLANEGELVASLGARGESWRQYAAAGALRRLDDNVATV